MGEKHTGESWKQTILGGIFFGTFMFILMGVFANWDNLSKELLLKEACVWAGFGFFWAITMRVYSHWHANRRAKKES